MSKVQGVLCRLCGHFFATDWSAAGMDGWMVLHLGRGHSIDDEKVVTMYYLLTELAEIEAPS